MNLTYVKALTVATVTLMLVPVYALSGPSFRCTYQKDEMKAQQEWVKARQLAIDAISRAKSGTHRGCIAVASSTTKNFSDTENRLEQSLQRYGAARLAVPGIVFYQACQEHASQYNRFLPFNCL